MWPFTKTKSDVLGLAVPSKPEMSVGEVRNVYTSQLKGAVAFDGPFPLLNEKRVFLCKSCGAPFDTWNLSGAIGQFREALLNPASTMTMFAINCRKCMTYVVFTAKDVVTGHTGDSLGPWNAQELDMAELSLKMHFKLSPAEVATIQPAHVHSVFYLYR